MSKFSLIFLFYLVNFAFCEESVESAFRSAEIVQDVTDDAPKNLLNVSIDTIIENNLFAN
jgi:hypothetical protein